jgi:hypothetical protein
MTNPKDFEVAYGDRRIMVTANPPIDVPQGTAWWIRLEDNWIKIRDRKPAESSADAELSDDVRAFVRDLFLKTGEHKRP